MVRQLCYSSRVELLTVGVVRFRSLIQVSLQLPAYYHYSSWFYEEKDTSLTHNIVQHIQVPILDL